jgi:RHS repeat-associated protein
MLNNLTSKSCFLLAGILVVALTQIIQAQTPLTGTTAPGLSPGSPAGSFALSGFENVNLYNGNLNVRLPLLRVGGRGTASYDMTITPMEAKWVIHHEELGLGSSFNYPSYEWWTGIRPGYSPGVLLGRGSTSPPCTEGSATYTLSRLTFTAADGTEYELRDQRYAGQPLYAGCDQNSSAPAHDRGRIFVAADGTAATFESDENIYDYSFYPRSLFYPSGYLMLRDGTKYRIDEGKVSWIRDRNGNKLSFSYSTSNLIITDSLNRQVTVTYNVQDVAPYGLCDHITYKDFNGTQRIIRVSRTGLGEALREGETLKQYYELFPETYGGLTYGYFNTSVTSSVWLPDGRRYQFLYNSYGEIARIILPTGGAIEYEYGPGSSDAYASGLIDLDWNQGYLRQTIYRRVYERRVYPDGGSGNNFESRMVYGGTGMPCGATGDLGANIDYMRPDGTYYGQMLARENHWFYGNPCLSLAQIEPAGYPKWKEGREYQTTWYDSNGTTALRRINQTWQQRAPISWWTGSPGDAPPNDPRLIETTTTLLDSNLVKKTSSINPQNSNIIGFDQFNNPTDVYEYDYGVGAAGSLVRHTHTDYLTTNPINGADYTSTSIHIRSLPTEQAVFDANNVRRALTSYEYDKYTQDTNHASLVDRSLISGLDASFNTSYGTRGNVTATTQHLLNSSGAMTDSISAYKQYDIAGNVVKIIDARGYSTSLDYSDRYGAPNGEARANNPPSELGAQLSYAFPTSITNALGHTGYTQHDYFTGAPVDQEDANGVVNSSFYNDPLGRPTQMIHAVNQPSVKSQVTFSYDDANRIISSTSDLNTYGDNLLKSQTLFDGLGRNVEARSYEGTSYIATRQSYDALGRVAQTSNPFRPAQESPVWTTTQYDALGRIRTVTTPDGAQVVSTYSGNQVTVQDQAGKQRSSITDALGRLRQVIEAPNNPSYNYLTSYTYDVLGNLTSVAQDNQTRYFMYDSLSRLIRAKIPEQSAHPGLALPDTISGNGQWSLGYAYDSNGNLSTKTDARGVTATFTYDPLNRNATTSYTDSTPAITRTYDGATNGKGRFWASYTGSVSQTAIDSYDALGRPLIQRQHFYANGSWGTAFTTQRTYNLSGSVATQTYPSGKTVTYTYDQAGRTSGFTGNLGDGATRTYAGSISYDQWNGLAREQFGTDTPLYHKQLRNVRGQLFDTRLSSVNDTWDWNRGRLISYYSNNHLWGQSGTDNNGNILFAENWIPPANATLDQAESIIEDIYTYDALNRISAVNEWRASPASGGGWTWEQQFAQVYSYDRFGNRTINAGQTWGTGINEQEFTVDVNTNRLGVPSSQSGVMQYDFAGNLINDTYSGTGTRTYDAENRMVTATNNASQQSVYTYDAGGQRVRRNSFNEETWQVYGMEGELLAEYAANATPTIPQKEYGYRNGQLLVIASTPQRTNVALSSNGSVASASTFLTYNGNPFAASRAIDGDRRGLNYLTGGAWQSSTATFPQWLEVDFQGSKTIDEIDLFMVQDNYANPSEPTESLEFAWYGLTAFEVQYWNGSSWLTVPDGSVTGNNKVWKKLTFPAINTSRIRVLTSASPDGHSRVAEIEAWGSAVAPPRTNVALSSNGGSASASTVLTYNGNPFPASRAIDGDRRGLNYLTGGVWQSSDATFPQWLQVDFQGSKTIDEIDLFTLQNDYANPIEPTEATAFTWYGLTGFEVQYWNDSSWVTVSGGSVTGNEKVWRKFTFSPITTTKIRVLTSASPDSWSRIAEVEAWQVSEGGNSGADIKWLVTDHLGSPRMIADKTGSLANLGRHDYLPFGEELFAGTGGRSPQQGYVADNVRQKFTQYERDVETGLDYAKARYYANTQGRFTGVDPLMSSAKPVQPQSWNRYTYCLNNPLVYVDPTGLSWFYKISEDKKTRSFYWYENDEDAPSDLTRYDKPLFDGGGDGPRSKLWLGEGGSYAYLTKEQYDEYAERYEATGTTGPGMTWYEAGALGAMFAGGGGRSSSSFGASSAGSYFRNFFAASKEGAAARGGSTTLFRAVQQGELDDILAAGMRYRLGPNSYGTGTKGFFSSADEAATFSQKMFGRFPNEGPYTITSTTVPNSFLRGYQWQPIAGEGNAIFIPPPPGPVRTFNFSPNPNFRFRQ